MGLINNINIEELPIKQGSKHK